MTTVLIEVAVGCTEAVAVASMSDAVTGGGPKRGHGVEVGTAVLGTALGAVVGVTGSSAPTSFAQAAKISSKTLIGSNLSIFNLIPPTISNYRNSA